MWQGDVSGADPQERIRAEASEEQADPSRDHGQNEALREQVTHDMAPAGAQRRPHRQLA